MDDGTNQPVPEHDQTLRTAFRDVMSGVCTPVSVVTAMSAGKPHGTTVSAFASLSMTPPMVLVSLDRGSDLLEMVRITRSFGLNVLSSEQAPLALNFARKGGADKFNGVEWWAEAGVPRLPGAGGFLGCDVTDIVDGGDHVVLLGLVRFAGTTACQPLTYHARMFGTHAALQEIHA
jgi:flavin reductase (DIM6/NTAB) family NADH-FMN oxidoreductase RutF